MATVVVDVLFDQFVVPLEKLHPASVAEFLVELGGAFDVGEGDHYGAVGCHPGEVRAFYPGPACKVLDRIAHRRADSLVDEGIRSAPGCSDRERGNTGSPSTTAWPLEPDALQGAPGSAQLSPRHDEQHAHCDEPSEFGQGDDGPDHGRAHSVVAASGAVTT